MRIDWLHFTPWNALSGGLLIGGGAALLRVFAGEVKGMVFILALLAGMVLFEVQQRRRV